VIGRGDLDEGVWFVVNGVLSSRNLCHLLTVREVNKAQSPVMTADNVRCWVVPAYDTPVAPYCTAIHIFARIDQDIRDSCDSAGNLRRGDVLVIMAPWTEMIRVFVCGSIGPNTRLDFEEDKGWCLGWSETDLVTRVLADESVTPKRTLNWSR